MHKNRSARARGGVSCRDHVKKAAEWDGGSSWTCKSKHGKRTWGPAGAAWLLGAAARVAVWCGAMTCPKHTENHWNTETQNSIQTSPMQKWKMARTKGCGLQIANCTTHQAGIANCELRIAHHAGNGKLRRLRRTAQGLLFVRKLERREPSHAEQAAKHVLAGTDSDSTPVCLNG